MKALHFLFFLTILLFFFEDPVRRSTEETRLNSIQVIGSHNSYKIRIDPPLMESLMKTRAALRSLAYEHIPLADQLDLGLRSLELDIFHDPEGGYYTDPQGLETVRSLGEVPEPFDVDGKLQVPGLKVFHVQDIDFRSHQLLFKDALKELKKWSQANEGHLPIIITINAKDSEIPQLKKPLPFTAAALQSIDAEIREVLEEARLITPDMVRGSAKTLEQAVLTNGWPALSEARNRFMFVLDEGEEKTDRYLSNFPNLEGAILFVNKEEGNPTAAFRIINDPIRNFDKIKSLVDLGYMVRTRSDADTKEARENDYNRFEKAKASGAQVITTDYYFPSKFFESDFKIAFEGGTYERVKQ